MTSKFVLTLIKSLASSFPTSLVPTLHISHTIKTPIHSHHKHIPTQTTMATTTTNLTLFLLPLLLLSLRTLAQNAPAPESAGPANLTAILEKNGQFTTFIKLLAATQVGNQIENQLNSSTEGLTVFAPTDNAFNNLKPGTLNSLTTQQQVQLVLYHTIPKFYTLSNLVLVPNPVRTQATDNDGVFGLNITGQNNQVNVSTGVVETQINNPLRQVAPLAVYQVDQVLLPEQLFGEKANAPKAAPATPAPNSKTTPSADSNSTVASEPTPAGNGSSGRNVGVGLLVGLGVVCMGVF